MVGLVELVAPVLDDSGDELLLPPVLPPEGLGEGLEAT
jgi:hypothetical protein